MQLTISNINKTYKNGVRALNDINLTISSGMFGLLGPNGAGKSSLMRTLATLQEPDSGTIRLGDIDLLRDKQKIRSLLGYMPQHFGVYPKASAKDLLHYLATLKGISNSKVRSDMVETLLELTNLHNVSHQAVSSFSGGMKQRFGIAQALLGDPKLVIVDEPTAGLDPEERNRFNNLLSQVSENVIVLLSTHIVSDVADLCTQIAIVDSGKILMSTSPEAAVAALKGKVWAATIEQSDLARHQEKFQLLSTRLSGGKTIIRVYNNSLPNGCFKSQDAELEDAYFAWLNRFDMQEAL